MAPIVTWKTLRLFVKTLTADGKYSLLNRDNLAQPNQMYFSEKAKKNFSIFLSFLKFTLNFEHFHKNMSLIGDAFPNYGFAKTWFSKCLKSPVLGDPSTGNFLTRSKICFNVHSSTVTIFVDHSEGN